MGIERLKDIREYWRTQAGAHGEDPSASWSDVAAIDLEIRTMSGYLRDGDRVIDIGCANGYSTSMYAAARDIEIEGVDYIPEMVEHAEARRRGLPGDVSRRMTFGVGDITDLDRPTASYGVAIVTRVLINLGTWENQLIGLRETLRVLRSGGLALFSEATVQGWNALNDFREEWGLPAIPMPTFNTYLDEERFAAAIEAEGAEVVEVRNFASSYFVGTRVIKPLLSEALGDRVDVARADAHFNRWCSLLPAAGDYGTQKLFVARRR